MIHTARQLKALVRNRSNSDSSQQYADEIMAEKVYSALMATSKKRGSEKVVLDGERILSEIFNSQDMISLWENYQDRFVTLKQRLRN